MRQIYIFHQIKSQEISKLTSKLTWGGPIYLTAGGWGRQAGWGTVLVTMSWGIVATVCVRVGLRAGTIYRAKKSTQFVVILPDRIFVVLIKLVL